MSRAAAANAARQLSRFRRASSGITVQFRGKPFVVRKEEVSGALAGEQGVPRTGLNELIGDTDPSRFEFLPDDFAPRTAEALPQVGQFVVCDGFAYEITHVNVKASADIPYSITAYALKKIWG